MIGFFSYGFPIGLSLYWNTFSIFGIIQQHRVSGWGGLKDLWEKKKNNQKTTDELLKLLNINGEVTVELKDEIIYLVLETEDSGIVIGRHGDILESLQTILALCISKNLTSFIEYRLK